MADVARIADPLVGADKSPTDAVKRTTDARDERRIGRIKTLGIVGLGGWFVLFTCGLLISSDPYRRALLPQVPQHASNKAEPLAPASEIGDQGSSARDDGASAQENNRAALSWMTRFQLWFAASNLGAVIKAGLLFSPTNVGLLCLLAGFVGGCAANLSWEQLQRRDAAPDIPERRLAYLMESPVAAAFRSFIIYLLIIGGLFAFMPDPFQLAKTTASLDPELWLRDIATQQAAYARLAALASVLAFLVGYDPTRLEGLFDLIPVIGKSQQNGGNGDTSTKKDS